MTTELEVPTSEPGPSRPKLPFDPQKHERRSEQTADANGLGDRRAPYVYDAAIIRAVNVAMVVQRPLLLSGEPGSGKSSLARDVAEVMGWEYLDEIVSSKTRARDLLWTFDAVRRLGDAQANDRKKVRKLKRYVHPGVLWRAFAPGERAPQPGGDAAQSARPKGVVVLIDEIDKADPDVPNDLLGVLGSGSFRVTETGEEVKVERTPFVVFTTNGERELPEAFLRRCVHLELKAHPDGPARRTHLERIVGSHYPEVPAEMVTAVLSHFDAVRAAAKRAGLREPGTAEMLDAIRACRDLGGDMGSETWRTIANLALWKHKTEPQLAVTPKSVDAPKAASGSPAGGAP